MEKKKLYPTVIKKGTKWEPGKKMINKENERTGITNLLQDLRDNGLKLRDLKTEQSTLEKIFVNLVKESNEN